MHTPPVICFLEIAATPKVAAPFVVLVFSRAEHSDTGCGVGHGHGEDHGSKKHKALHVDVGEVEKVVER